MLPIGTGLGGAASSSSMDWPGGTGSVVASGTWGGATLVIQFSPNDGTTWITLSDVSMTANGTDTFAVCRSKIRSTTSGGVGTSLNVYVQPVVEPVSEGRGA